MGILSSRTSQHPNEEKTMNLNLIATTMLFLLSASALAARVESEDALSAGSRANKTRTVIGAAATLEGGRCDFGEPVAIQANPPSTGETVGRAVCHAA
jgi:hypothetical protein